QALADAGLEVNDSNAWDIGAIIATGGGGIRAVADEMETLVTRGWERVGPMMVPLMIPNMASCQVSMTDGIKGPVVTNTAAGDAAGGLVSGARATARARHGRGYAELCGGSNTGAARHVSAPARSGESARRAIAKAIEDADLTPDDIDDVCAHGTGTPLNASTE